MKFNLNLDSINYIKIIYKDSNNKLCITKAAIRFLGEREIISCAKFENGFRVETPQDIILSFVCDNGLYRTTTILKYFEYRDPYVYFTLKTPQGLEYQQNREYFRVKMHEDAILSFKDGNKIKRLLCKTHDISANGVRLEIPENINNIDEVGISILFDSREVKAKAKFIRLDNEDDILKASFTFTYLKENDMDFISRCCIQKQLEYKRSILY